MKRIAIIAAVLDMPSNSQKAFNEIISVNKHLVRGRMGIPFDKEGIAVVSVTVMGEMDEINALTGKLGKIEHVTIKTAVSNKQVD